jgi:hypothetical protein
MTVRDISLPEFEAAIAPLFTNNDLGLSPGLKDTLFRQLGI